MQVSNAILFSDMTTLLQFSVGGNLAFATVLTLYDKVLVRKQKAISDLRASAIRLKSKGENGQHLTAGTLQAIQDVERLETDISRFAKQIEHITYDIFRYVAIGSAFTAFGLLWYATYHMTGNAGNIFQILTFLTIAPLFLFSLYALFWTSYRTWTFDRRRDKLDSKLMPAVAGQ